MSRISESADVLASIQKQKRAVRKEIADSQAAITSMTHAIISPAAKVGRQGMRVSQMVSRGMAIFEGVRIGLKLMRSVRSLFGKRKRR